MSEENVEIVRRMLERFGEGDVLWDVLHEKIEIHDHDILDASEYRGHAGVLRWIEDWEMGLPVLSFEAQEFIDAGDDVVVAVVRLKARGRGSGVELERQDGLVYALRAGKVVRLDYYNSRSQALKAVGLAE